MPEYQPMAWSVEPIEGMLGKISGRYLQDYDGRPHMGLDIAVPEGTPIVTPGDATVVAFTNDGSFGLGVCLDFVGTEWYVLFAHCRAVMVAPGARVTAGQVIALSGNTGKSSGPHCHIQVCKSTNFPRDVAQNTDPLPFIEAIGQQPPAPIPPPPAALDEARVRTIAREEIDALVPGLFRRLQLLYWADQIGGDYTDAAGNPLPPDAEVVRAIAAHVFKAGGDAIEGVEQ